MATLRPDLKLLDASRIHQGLSKAALARKAKIPIARVVALFGGVAAAPRTVKAVIDALGIPPERAWVEQKDGKHHA